MKKSHQPRITHLIFDCDGVLIDSELIGCRVAAEFFTQAGYPLTRDEYIQRFAGKSHSQILDEIKNETGISLEHRMNDTQRREAQYRAFQSELKATQGIHTALSQITLPKAIASGSSLERLHLTLGLTGLKDTFAPHIYSAEQVSNGKPAPDVFLLAARKLKAKPKQCLVIGDSHHDMEGGKAAGMLTLGYVGASHGTAELEQRLRNHGAYAVLNDMRVLPDMITSINKAFEHDGI
ncbi:MAG: HAD-IA family hydrolase [Alphaproteobacteria bacterium]